MKDVKISHLKAKANLTVKIAKQRLI